MCRSGHCASKQQPGSLSGEDDVCAATREYTDEMNIVASFLKAKSDLKKKMRESKEAMAEENKNNRRGSNQS